MAALFGALAPAYAGLMGDFGGRDPFLVLAAIALGVVIGAILLAVSYIFYLKADRIEFDLEVADAGSSDPKTKQ